MGFENLSLENKAAIVGIASQAVAYLNHFVVMPSLLASNS